MTTSLEKVSLKQTVEYLAQSPLFSQLGPQQLDHLAQQFETTFLKAGSILMHEGDIGDNLYLVVNGRLRSIKNYNKETQVTLAEMGAKELIGEFALFTGNPRTATVIAIRDSTLLKLSKENFFDFTQQHPLQLFNITKQCVLRLLTPNKQTANTINTIAILPAGEDRTSHHWLANHISTELNKLAPLKNI